MPETLPQYPSPYYGGYYYQVPHTNPGYQANLVETIQNCEETCEHMTTFLKRKPDVKKRTRQLQLLRDCADICTLTAKYIARNSEFSKCIANLCAYICEACGMECAKFPDLESQNCAKICLHCARECRIFAMS